MGRGHGLSLGSLHVSFLGFWVGWVGRGQESRLMFPSFGVLAPFLCPSGLLGRMGGPRPRSWAPVELPSFWVLGRMGRPRQRSWAITTLLPLSRPKHDPSAHPPGFSHFTLTDNGGQGDCAYLAIAIALADANKTKSKTCAVSQDFEPGGRLQAQLRLLASKELANNPSRYFAPGDDRASTVPSQTASAGVWADSVSLSALCQASQVELRIWGFSAKENRWALYFLSPFKTTKPKSAPVIWLHLKDQHYQWLKPKDCLNSDLVDSWVRHACYKPASLLGAGESQFGPDALDIMGLSVPSTPAKSVCSFPSVSCRKANARKPGLDSPVVSAQTPASGTASPPQLPLRLEGAS